MLLELSNHRPYGNATKMSTTVNSHHYGEPSNKCAEGLSKCYNENTIYNSMESKSVVQCYSVSTGKVLGCFLI